MSLIGRPRSLDDGKRREVCAVVSAGAGLEAAARYVGCSVSTIRREALRNHHFGGELRNAEKQAELHPLRAMRKAAGTHWRAAAWMLERTHPRRFARPRPHTCSARELHDVIDAVIQQAVDEIADPEMRERVCRRLMVTAYRSSRALAAEERSRLDPRRGLFDVPLSMDERRIQNLLAEVRGSAQAAYASVTRGEQNPPTIANAPKAAIPGRAASNGRKPAQKSTLCARRGKSEHPVQNQNPSACANLLPPEP